VKFSAVIAMIAALPMLSACPPPERGVSRGGTIEVANLRCPEDALEATPGIAILSGKEHRNEGRTHRVVSFDAPEMKAATFLSWWDGDGPLMNVHIGVDRYREAQMTPDEARAIVSLSKRIETEIEERCGVRLDFKTKCHDELCAAVGATASKLTTSSALEVSAS
jgi:hypothetical protein